jgi:outer membrane protein TolC
LLDRRPDLREAEHRLHAATARVGVNVAQLFPDITLTTNFGYQSDQFSTLFQDGSYVYSLVFNAVQPLFRGGELKAQVREAEAVVQERAAEYASAILNALKEVEDALVNEVKLRERYTYLSIRFTEARASEKLARDKYLKGVEQLVTVLETERTRRLSENALAVLHGDLWEARVNLLLALGGDWKTEKYAFRQIDSLEDLPTRQMQE